jgi:hypothetical protein
MEQWKLDCMADEKSEQQVRIANGLADLLVGEDKWLTIVAAMSLACTTAHQIGIEKLELQKLLMRMYDRREAEARADA